MVSTQNFKSAVFKNRMSGGEEPSGAEVSCPKYSPSPWLTASYLPAVKAN